MRFRALDGWRGVCALLVAVHHLEVHGWLYWQPLVRNAWLFVDFFFVLSGFVIAHSYGDRLDSGREIKSFAIRRFGRLWPLHAAVLLALVMLEFVRLFTQHWLPSGRPAFSDTNSLTALVTNLLLIQSFGLHSSLTWNGPAWSISTEFYTYLVFALVCFWAPSRPTRTAAAIGIALAGAAVLALFSPLGMKESIGWGEARCLYGFFTGMIAYEIWRSGALARFGGHFAELLAVGLVLAFLTFCDDRIDFAAPLVFAVAVLVFAGERGFVSSLLTSRPGAALGRWSYSIYMVHTLVLALLFSATHMLDLLTHGAREVQWHGGTIIELGSANDLFVVAYLALVVAVAATTWRLIEVPGQRWINCFAGNPVRREDRQSNVTVPPATPHSDPE